MVTRKEIPEQAMLGLTLYRLTGTKEAVMNLHRFGHTISYSSIILHSEKWSELAISAVQRLLQSFPVHSSIDNDDGWQKTYPGFGTTHDINTMLFLPPLSGKNS